MICQRRTCGHDKRDHIYEEGACRPGFACLCPKFLGTEDRVKAVMDVFNTHRWRTMGVSTVECECGQIFTGDGALTQFPADEVFRRHLAWEAICAADGCP